MLLKSSGKRLPSIDGPKIKPAINSPITAGCFQLLNNSPNIRPTVSRTANMTRNEPKYLDESVTIFSLIYLSVAKAYDDFGFGKIDFLIYKLITTLKKVVRQIKKLTKGHENLRNEFINVHCQSATNLIAFD